MHWFSKCDSFGTEGMSCLAYLNKNLLAKANNAFNDKKLMYITVKKRKV